MKRIVIITLVLAAGLLFVSDSPLFAGTNIGAADIRTQNPEHADDGGMSGRDRMLAKMDAENEKTRKDSPGEKKEVKKDWQERKEWKEREEEKKEWKGEKDRYKEEGKDDSDANDNSKGLKKGEVKGEEGRATAREKATDKGTGEKQGRPWWQFWKKETETGGTQ